MKRPASKQGESAPKVISTAEMACSVIINTYNREPYLRQLLAALEHLTYESLEVVVVDGPSTDGTPGLLEEYAGRIKAVQCPVANLSVSRNLGIAAASGEVVVFIDDDALPGSPDWLEKLLAPFQGDAIGAVGASGGPVLHRDTSQHEFHGGMTSDYGQQIFRQDGAITTENNNRWMNGVRGCNCAFRRSALVEIGGFDEYYSYYLDETDVCHRMARRGYTVAYQPDASVRHYSAASARRVNNFDQNWREIARSDTYFCLKNGQDILPIRFVKTLWLARRKHFFRDIFWFLRSRQVSPLRGLKYLGQWAAGLSSGLAGGVLSRRRTKLGDSPSLSFLPLPRSRPERKLRICLLSQLLPPNPGAGGIGRYTDLLAKGLHQLGHEVHVITRGDEALQHRSLDLAIHGIPAGSFVQARVFPDRPVLNTNTAYSLAVFYELLDLYRQGVVFDVVQAPNWDAEGLALILSQIYPTVLTLHTPLVQVVESQDWTLTDDLRACMSLDRWQIEHADAVVCNSWGAMESYRDKMGISPYDLHTVRRVAHGVRAPKIAAKPRAAGETKRLLFVGRIERRKGAHVLFEVLPELLASYPDWIVDIVGDETVPDSKGSTLKQQFLARHAGSPWLKRVRFLGRIEDEKLDNFYQSCDVFVAPSLYESFGLIYLEAMRFGKPVVGCRTGGVPEVIEDGVDGLLAEPGDAKSLRKQLDKLMGDPAGREIMGEAAARKVIEHFDHLSMARKTIEVYEELIERVGVERRSRLEDFQVIDVDLYDRQMAGASSEWEVRTDSVSGSEYLVAIEPESILSFSGPAGHVLQLEFLRHDFSGVAEIAVNSQPAGYVDLYGAQSQSSWTHQVPLPANGTDEAKVVLKVHAERNPESHGNEVWIKRAFFAKDARLLVAAELAQGSGENGNRPSERDRHLAPRAKLKPVEAEMNLYPPDSDIWISGQILNHGIWEPLETELVMNLLPEDGVFVDVGAQIGYYSVVAGTIVREHGRVISFEPEPTNHEMLLSNIELNGLQSTVCVNQKAAWSGRETLNLHLTERPENQGAHWITEDAGPRTVAVEAVALDEALSDLDGIDLAKVDVEGREYQVLSGMKGLISRLPRLKVITEFTATNPHAHDVVDMIEGLGLSATLIDERYGLAKPISISELRSMCDGQEMRVLSLLLQNPRHNKKASVVVVNTGGRKQAERAIKPLLESTDADLEVAVVPIGQSDPKGHTATDRNSRVRYVRRVQDCGIAAARSLGICLSEGECVILADPGRMPTRAVVDDLLGFLETRTDGVVVDSEDPLTKAPSIMAFRRADYHRVGGYEDGWDDGDLLIRFIEEGLAPYSTTKNGLKPIDLRLEDIPHLQEGFLRRSGGWNVKRDTVSGADYLFSDKPGTTLDFVVAAGTILNLVFQRLDWCGIVEVTVGEDATSRIDLFGTRRASQWSHRIEIAGESDAPVRVRMTVSGEKHPDSFGHEVWIRRMYCIGRPTLISRQQQRTW